MKQKRIFIILVILAFFLSCNSLFGPKSIKAGRWTATTDFGGFELVVDSGGTSISEIKFNFSNWHGTSGSITVKRTPSWPITEREFEIECDIAGYGSEDLYTITGTFADNCKKASGSWTEAINDTTYSGSWEGEWTGSSSFVFK